MRFVGANPVVTITGLEELPRKTNYFAGSDFAKWIIAVPSYRQVSYNDIYPGINLICYGSGDHLEHD
jgi:hypothetical protein